jgi:anti-sigma B factor antagonist/stage II sporulation protein AA (anti-sigma F factor antagonist)
MIVVQPKDNVLIVKFTSQKILSDTGIADIGRELLELPDQADRNILLDFDGVDLMSSAMFGKLIALDKKCQQKQIEMRICNVCADMMEVVQIAHLDRYLKIHASQAEALKAFGT